jgi:thiol-disulfide isomerase/thioredoxin
VLTLYTLGGRKLMTVVRRRARGHLVEQGLGLVLVLTGLAIATNLDVQFENALANGTAGANHSSLLAFLVDPTHGLENSQAVQHRLNSLRPESKFVVRAREAATKAVPPTSGVSIPGVSTPSLPDLGPAPNFTDNQRWFNTPAGRPLTLGQLRGKVVIVDFWTYTCINCIRTLPFLKGLYATYHRYGLEIVGVESPEFVFEQEASNVQQAINSDGLTYPVVQDNHLGTWNAYQNQYWPAEYLIDAKGEVRHTQFGEGMYKEDEAAVRQLLFDAGVRNLPPPTTAHAIMPSATPVTPETYLNPNQYQQYGQTFAQPVQSGTRHYTGSSHVALNEFALRGYWSITSESATPVQPGASIDAGVQAARTYLVMTSSGNVPRTGRVLLDGKPIPAADAGSDVKAGGTFTVTGQRLYSLVSLPGAQQHVVTVQVPAGVSAYDFTFG